MCRLIPAIDLIDGRCVRLKQGNFDDVTTYLTDPVEQAIIFQNLGAQYLHLVDLDGAKAGSPKNLKVLNKIVSATRLKVDYGGGLRSISSIRETLQSGADRINLGSLAITNPKLLLEELKAEEFNRIILALDFNGEDLTSQGWQATVKTDFRSLVKRYISAGVCTLCSTQVKRDGMLSGPDLDLYQNLRNEFPTIEIIASGGVSSLSDLDHLNRLNIDGAIVGKAIFEGRINNQDLKKYFSRFNNVTETNYSLS